jgi:hypothetical protein
MIQHLIKAAFAMSILPVDLAFDMITLNGITTEKNSSYTLDRLEDVSKNLKRAFND